MKIATVIQSDENPFANNQVSQDVSNCLRMILSDIRNAQSTRKRDDIDNQKYIYKVGRYAVGLLDFKTYSDFVLQTLKEIEQGGGTQSETISTVFYLFLNQYVHTQAFKGVLYRLYRVKDHTREEIIGSLAVFCVFLLMPLSILRKITNGIVGHSYTPLRLFHKKENDLKTTIKRLDLEVSKHCAFLRHIKVDNYRLYSTYVLYFISTLYVDFILAGARSKVSRNVEDNKSKKDIINKIYDALLEAEFSFKFTNSEVLFMDIKKTAILYFLFRSIEKKSLEFLADFEALSSDEERIAFIKETSFVDHDCAPLFYFLCFDDESREIWEKIINEYSFLKNSAKNKHSIIRKIDNAYKFMIKNNAFPQRLDSFV